MCRRARGHPSTCFRHDAHRYRLTVAHPAIRTPYFLQNYTPLGASPAAKSAYSDDLEKGEELIAEAEYFGLFDVGLVGYGTVSPQMISGSAVTRTWILSFSFC